MYWVRRNRIGGSHMPSHLDEIRLWKSSGVRKVLILAEDWEIEESWGDVDYYLDQLRSEGLSYLHVPIPDGYPPSRSQFQEIVQWLDKGANLVHCVAGIGRTGTVLAGYLILREGVTPDQAVQEVRKYRPGAVQTMQQFLFLEGLGKLED
ncbi:protein-tyrosine phosphatase family protein [Metallosphaera hakonensis]|uniref:Protein phosphatase n=1 Tax=Metallosphaera hakonensis JCM 8857 = DSM 7519 TaxID=1293036 RepID=A0A2U9IWI9_9CREN|nr:protein-tyrosine phosphatase family protein [Metallosphaera hakonensis]AWS00268.1 protein phosphatase [Metallosphaera hakonensis JCM 8857 = DSM 7519]